MNLVTRFLKLTESEKKEVVTVIYEVGIVHSLNQVNFRSAMKRFMLASHGDIRAIYKELRRLDKAQLDRFFNVITQVEDITPYANLRVENAIERQLNATQNRQENHRL
jgi:hypothetical protein